METIASIENMEDVASELSNGLSGAVDSVRETNCTLDSISESTNAALANAEKAVEETLAEVCRLESLVQSLESQISSADGDKENGEDNSAKDELATAQNDLTEAKEVLKDCEEKREKASEISKQVETLRQQFQQTSQVSLMRMGELGEQCANRIRLANEALEKYIAEHPGSQVASFANWSRWTPAANVPVTPNVLSERMKSADIRAIIAHEAERDPRFRFIIEDYRQRWTTTNELTKKADIFRQARRNVSGELAERIVVSTFRPLGDVSTQDRTVFDDGRYTKTDITIRNLRAPLILGRGNHLFAPKGGTVAFEVKAGCSDYLKAQGDHLVFQAGGHRAANAAATICTADIHDLPADKERELRDRLKAAGSPIIGMLPRKKDIDRSLFEAIAYGIGKERI